MDKIELDQIKTKTIVKMLDALKVGKALIVTEESSAADLNKVKLSAANIQDVKTAETNTINVYDILKYDTVVITEAAVKKLEEVYA